MIRYPACFLAVPERIACVNDPMQDGDLAAALQARRDYLIPGEPEPYMVDIVRGFRLAKGASVYIEVGTQDKGNIAWLARHVLAPGATIIDIDLLSYTENDRRIASELGDLGFDYHAIRGDCLSDETLAKVREILAGRGADVIFCDSHYTYEHTLTEFGLYFPLVRPGGYLFFHDVMWRGDPNENPNSEVYKLGKALAVQQLDRFHPVYIVEDNAPAYRYAPPSLRRHYWGGLGIIPSEPLPSPASHPSLTFFGKAAAFLKGRRPSVGAASSAPT